MLRHLSALVALSLAVFASMGAAAQTQPAGDAGKVALKGPTEPNMKLLDAGTGEKRALRYHFTKGSESVFKMTMTMAMTVEMGGQKMPSQPAPGMMMTMSMKVLDIDAANSATCDFSLTDADVANDPRVQKAMTDAMRQSIKTLVGMKGKIVLNDRGIPVSFDLQLPANADPNAAQQIDQMEANFSQYCLPLPEEAIGAGAKWQVLQVIEQQGLTIDQTTTMTLKSISGDAMELDFATTQSALNQQIESPQMPGMKIDVKSMTSKGEGTASASLTSPFPTKSDGMVGTDMHVAMPGMGEMKQHIDMIMKGEAVAAKPAG